MLVAVIAQVSWSNPHAPSNTWYKLVACSSSSGCKRRLQFHILAPVVQSFLKGVDGESQGGSRRWSGGQIRGSGGLKSPVGPRGEAPAEGLVTESPRSWSIFLKYTTWNLRPGENERHNLMPLMAFFFIAVHTAHQHCVVSVSCFIHLFSSRFRSEAPAGGLGDGVPQKLEHFLKYTAWN